MGHKQTQTFQWHTDALKIDFLVNKNGVICLDNILPPTANPSPQASPNFESSELPLISIRLSGEGNGDIKTAKTLIGTTLSDRLQYLSHKTIKNHDRTSETLVIECSDDVTGIHVAAKFTVYGSIPVVRAETTVTNTSTSNTDVVITNLSTLTIGNMTTASYRWFEDYSLSYANSTWFREAQWEERSLPSVGLDNNGILELGDGLMASLAHFELSSRGSFSTGGHLPMGTLKHRNNEDTWMWQVESSGSWRWDIGDFKDNIYLVAGGPTFNNHGWKKRLSPGQFFTSVPVACCRVQGDEAAAFAAMTDYRRQIRRPHDDMDRMPIIFNDYMNCLMGDPDEDKVRALLDPVAQLGAEYFVIDAGWYADDGNWWDDVGLWEPSTKRFPSGFMSLMGAIRSKGLIPGLWLEPEVVGVRSSMGSRLPDEAFFQEDGYRVVEKRRWSLDYRHPEVIAWMNKVMHNLIDHYGVKYFKFDYNIDVLQGTDVDGPGTAGAAHLEHQRAYLGWVGALLDNYRGVVIETCSGGANRLDYAMLAVHSIQSTSDQQEPKLYAAIAAACPAAVTPEQSASWAYPQPGWSDEVNALSVVNSMMGRVYLSGRVDQLSDKQLSIVKEGLDVYREMRGHLRHAHPIWPLGLPKWHEDWVALGLTSAGGKTIHLAVWRRGGPTKMDIPLRTAQGTPKGCELSVIYPTRFTTKALWNGADGTLHLELPAEPCARILKIDLCDSQ
ncbi:alpha-galactosidase [Colletotrichum sp. SAR11_240]|nr:alpha-galactosidase [Colletotrichum sp. SAR11_240]